MRTCEPGGLASPVRLSSQADNVGNAVLDVGELRDRDNAFFSADDTLVPPLQIVFTSDSTYDIMDATDPIEPRHLDPPMRGLSYTPGVVNQLLPEPGTTVVSAFGTALSALPDAPALTTDTDPLGNGYPSGTLTLTYRDESGVSLIDERVVGYPAGASAREIAEILSVESGVQARAVTEIELSDLSVDGIGAAFGIALNGQVFTDVETLDDLALAINENSTLANRGISALSDGERLSITALFGDDLSVHVTGDAGEGVTVANDRGDSLRVNGVVGSYRGVTVGGTLVVEMQEGISLTADAPGVFTSTPLAHPADYGFSLEMRGVPNVGDRFDLSFNTDAVSDNRNGLKIAQLASQELIGDPPSTYNNVYASIVLEVGSQQNEANVQRDAAKVLLDQSIATRESISGVNLDEEAADLIRLEQAYNASAQVISVARDVFDVLFQAVQ